MCKKKKMPKSKEGDVDIKQVETEVQSSEGAGKDDKASADETVNIYDIYGVLVLFKYKVIGYVGHHQLQ